MNIFATSPLPKECARALDDARVVKMVVETSQILSTAASLNGFRPLIYGLPKPTHTEHPVVRWTSGSRANFDWVLEHFRALLEEYAHRYGKQHRYEDHVRFYRMANNGVTKIWRNAGHLNCACNLSLNLDFRHMDNVYAAYREYLNARWASAPKPPKWTRREKPDWAKVAIQQER